MPPVEPTSESSCSHFYDVTTPLIAATKLCYVTLEEPTLTMRSFSPFQRPSLDAALESYKTKHPPRKLNPLIKLRTLQSVRSTKDDKNSDLVSTLRSLSITQPDLIRTILDDLDLDGERQGTEAIFSSATTASVDDSAGISLETQDDDNVGNASNRDQGSREHKPNSNAIKVEESLGVEMTELQPEPYARAYIYRLAAMKKLRAQLMTFLQGLFLTRVHVRSPLRLINKKQRQRTSCKDPKHRDCTLQSEQNSLRRSEATPQGQPTPSQRKTPVVMILPFVQRKGKSQSKTATPHHDLPSLLSSSFQESVSEGCDKRNPFQDLFLCGNAELHHAREGERISSETIDKLKSFLQCGSHGETQTLSSAADERESDEVLSALDGMKLALLKASTAGEETSTESSYNANVQLPLVVTQDTISTQEGSSSFETSTDSSETSSFDSFQALVDSFTGSNLSFLELKTLEEAMAEDRRWVW